MTDGIHVIFGLSDVALLGVPCLSHSCVAEGESMDVAEFSGMTGIWDPVMMSGCLSLHWDWAGQSISALSCPWISYPSISNCLLLPEPSGTGQTPTPAPLADVRVQTSRFCLLFLRVNDWKDAFLRGFNPNCVGRGCCVCLVWHRTRLIPFGVSVALSE